MIRYSLLTANIVLLGVVISFVSSSPNPGQTVQHNALSRPVDTTTTVANPLDQLSAADIAVHASRMTGLEESLAIKNDADSIKTQLTTAPAENSVAAKPQIVSTDLKSKDDIKTYIAQQGDTVSSVAQKFGVTSDSIKWSNGLTREDIKIGHELTIPPVPGIVYIVKPGDTVDSIAQQFSANKQKLVLINDAEISGLQVGEKIIVPDAIQPVARRAASAARTSYPAYGGGFAFGSTAIYGHNGYVRGYCTWYAASRVSVPTNWGNARTWASGARRTPGWTVSSRPVPGAIAQTARMNSLGHVAIVEEVSEDGATMKYSDMNGIAGFGRVGYSGWVSSSQFEAYIYR